MKRQTSKLRRHSRSQILEVRVMSPRIAWFGCLKFLKGTGKVLAILALLGGLGWGIRVGVQRALYQNQEFRLQTIDLNANPVIDETALIEKTGISLPANLFEIDIKAVAEKLETLPGVACATAERHLPGTLVVRITPRIPRAWISVESANLVAHRQAGDMLVDHQGIVYPCPPLQLETATKLPVIQLSTIGRNGITPGKKIDQPELEPCIRLLDAACENDPLAIESIDTIRQANDWSLTLITRQGTIATFGLADHSRQVSNLRAALDHAAQKGYDIKTINLIPKQNVPITLKEDGPVPPALSAADPAPQPTPAQVRQDRSARDRDALLNRR